MSSKPTLAELAAEFDLTSEQIADAAKRIAGSVFRLSELWALHATPEATVRQSLRRIARSHRVRVPAQDGLTQQINRMRDPAWWRQQLKKRLQAVELLQIRRGQVNAAASPFVSAEALRRFDHDRALMKELLASLEALNESTGEVVPLADLIAQSQANPANRRKAMMARIKGIELHAQSKGHKAHFLTITAPSRMHRWLKKGNRANVNYEGADPCTVQTYLNGVWRRAMRSIQREGLIAYGLRVVEPHHDACPHWHMLVFTAPEHTQGVIDTLRAYAMADSPNEWGATEHRFGVEAIDPAKGSAVGYVAKYVSKSIDGEGVDIDHESGRSGTEKARRTVAWARLWTLRQFQFFGMPAITPTRELYRHDGRGLESQALTEAHQATKANDYAAWLRACDLHGLSFRVQYRERRSTRYADETSRTIQGLRALAADISGPRDIVTRDETWSIQARQEQRDDLADRAPWTRFNNCAAVDPIEVFERERVASHIAGGRVREGIEKGGGESVPHRAPLPSAGRGDGDRPGAEHSEGPHSCKNIPPRPGAGANHNLWSVRC